MKWILLLLGGIISVQAEAQVLISELMADPSPVVGLPNAEYVEIYNSGTEGLSLGGFQLTDGSKTATFPEYTLAAKEWLLLCASSKTSLFDPWGTALGLPSFPSLNNGGETIRLLDADGHLVDSVQYHPNWYGDASKKSGGWSLELQNIDSPCGAFWAASNHPQGGTPATANGSNSQASSTGSLSLSNFSDTLLAMTSSYKTYWQEATFSLYDDGGKAIPLELRGIDGHQAQLSYLPLQKGKAYQLQITQLRDCAGSQLDTVFNQVLGDRPQFLELLITEIMADPSPTVGLPDAEYIEVYNATDRYLSLQNCTLEELNKSHSLPDTILPPQSYIALMQPKYQELFAPHIATLGVSGFPSLSNGGEYLGLFYQEQPLFEVTYSDAWYGSEWASEGGFSLEMLRLNRPCMQEGNWQASAATAGGTPAQANSQTLEAGIDESPPTLLNAYAPDSLHLYFLFDEILHPQAFEQLRLESEEMIQVDALEITGAQVTATLSRPLNTSQGYQFTLVGAKDCASNIALYTEATIHLASIADSGDVIINEVLPKPFTGGVRFIEVYNRSDKYLNLQNWKVARFDENQTIDRVVTLTEDYLLLPPKSYHTFSSDKQLLKAHYPQAIDSLLSQTPSKLPSWGFDQEQAGVLLLNPFYKAQDQMELIPEMVFELIDDDRGVSIERLAVSSPSELPQNWRSASSTAGYATPSFLNSQSKESRMPKKHWSVYPKVFSPNQDGYQDYLQIDYQDLPYGTVASLSVFDSQGRLYKSLASSHLLGEQGFYIWDGMGLQGQLAPMGAYIIYIEYFQSNGQSFREKLVVAVSR